MACSSLLQISSQKTVSYKHLVSLRNKKHHHHLLETHKTSTGWGVTNHWTTNHWTGWTGLES